MHIAVLMTNTDESLFALSHPKDGEKFQVLLHETRPDWRISIFSVKDGVFPETLDGIDGVLITGSPASVNAPDPWIAELLAMIRKIVHRRIPMFGACFGHQAIAKALGGAVGPNPQGWEFGLLQTHLAGQWSANQDLNLFAAHKEQVTELPPHAIAVGHTPGCTFAAFEIGRHVLTTQYHPEMTTDFMAALIGAFGDTLPKDVTRRARTSIIGGTPSRADIRDVMVRFFEQR